MKRFVVVMTVWAMGLAGVLAGIVFPSSASAAPTRAGAYGSVTPSRLLDTRTGLGQTKAVAVAPMGTVALKVLGRGNVPTSGVSAVVLNVTVVHPTKSGFITAFGAGKARPGVSNLNFLTGQTVPNLVIAPVGVGGVVNLFNGSTGNTHLLADVSGYYLNGALTDAGAFGSLAPIRMMDTRTGLGAPKAQIASNRWVDLQVANRGGVPASGVSAVVLNVTATGSTKNGAISAYATGSARPGTSNLNFAAGQTVPNLVIAPVSASGKVSLFNDSTGSTSIIADVFGFFKDGAPITSGAYGSVVPEPTRLLDTRNGTGTSGGAPFLPVAANSSINLPVTGSGIPAGVSAVVLNVTATQPAAKGFITVFAAGATQAPVASNVNFAAGKTVANLVIAPVSATGEVTLFNGSAGTTHLIADVFGYVLDADLDVLNPGPVTGLTVGTITATSIALSWTNPTADFDKVMIRRADGATAPATPADGIEVLTDSATTAIDTAVTASKEYSYAVFALDAAGNVSDAVNVTATTSAAPAAATSTVLAVTPPSGEAPGTRTLTATVTADVAGSVEFFNGTTSLGSSVVAVGVASITLTDLGVGNYSYTATFTPTNAAAFAPSTSTAVAYVVTADTTAPAPATGLAAVATIGATTAPVLLTWTNPSDADFTGVMIRRSLGNVPPATVNDGDLLTADHPQESYTNATGLEGTQYSYSVFAHDAAGNDAAPVTVTVTTLTRLVAVLSINGSTGTTARTTANGFDPIFDVTGSHAGTGKSIVSGSLNFGDGTTPQVFTGDLATWDAFHTYTAEGTVTATLEVTDSAGVTASDTVTVTVLAAPTAAITAINPPVRPGEVTFALNSSTPAGTAWTDYVVTYGDGTAVQLVDGPPPATLTHLFGSDGPFTVSISAYNNADGFVTASTTVGFHSTAPARVGSLAATVVSDTEITLNWLNPTDADFAGVMIRRLAGPTAPVTITDGTEVAVLVASATSYSNTGLTAGNEYSYAVFSKDNVPNYSVGAGVTATTSGTDTTAPADVTGLWVDPASSTDNSVALRWVNPTDGDFTGVMIRRADGGTPPATVNDGVLIRDLTDLPGQHVPYLVDTTVIAGTQYSYTLFAHDGIPNYAAGVGLPYKTTGTAPHLTPPGPVGTLTAVAVNDTEIKLDWVNPTVADFAGVTIRRLEGVTAPSATTGELVEVPASATATSFTDTGLTAGTPYSYTVFAYDADNNQGVGVSVSGTTTQVTTVALLVDTPRITVGGFVDFDASRSYAATGQTLSGTLDYGDGTPVEALTGDPWFWLFGHSYDTAGAKTVTLSVTDTAGITLTKAVTVDVYDAPTAAITIVGNPASVEVGQLVTFTLDSSTPAGTAFTNWTVHGDSFDWDFNFGTPAPATYTHTFTQAGTFTVNFDRDNDALGSAQSSMVVTVVAVAVPIP